MANGQLLSANVYMYILINLYVESRDRQGWEFGNDDRWTETEVRQKDEFYFRRVCLAFYEYIAVKLIHPFPYTHSQSVALMSEWRNAMTMGERRRRKSFESGKDDKYDLNTTSTAP